MLCMREYGVSPDGKMACWPSKDTEVEIVEMRGTHQMKTFGMFSLEKNGSYFPLHSDPLLSQHTASPQALYYNWSRLGSWHWGVSNLPRRI